METNRRAPSRTRFTKKMMGGSFAILPLLWAITAFTTDKPKFSLGTIPEPKRETFQAALEKSWAAGNSDRLRDLWGPAIRVTPGGMDKFPEEATPRGTLTLQKGEFFSYGRIHFWRGRLQLKSAVTPVSGLASIFFTWQDIGGGWKVRYFMISGPLACSPAPWPLGNRSRGIPLPASELQQPGSPDAHGGVLMGELMNDDLSLIFHGDRIYRKPGKAWRTLLAQSRFMDEIMVSQFALGDGILLQAKALIPSAKHAGPARGELEIVKPLTNPAGRYVLSFRHYTDACPAASLVEKS